MRVADDDVMLLAGLHHARHPFQQLRVIVLPRIAELLAEVALADQDRADALDLGEDGVEILDSNVVH